MTEFFLAGCHSPLTSAFEHNQKCPAEFLSEALRVKVANYRTNSHHADEILIALATAFGWEMHSILYITASLGT